MSNDIDDLSGHEVMLRPFVNLPPEIHNNNSSDDDEIGFIDRHRPRRTRYNNVSDIDFTESDTDEVVNDMRDRYIGYADISSGEVVRSVRSIRNVIDEVQDFIDETDESDLWSTLNNEYAVNNLRVWTSEEIIRPLPQPPPLLSQPRFPLPHPPPRLLDRRRSPISVVRDRQRSDMHRQLLRESDSYPLRPRRNAVHQLGFFGSSRPDSIEVAIMNASFDDYYSRGTQRRNVSIKLRSSVYMSIPPVDDVCAICTSPYESDEKVSVLVCKHVYHTECIEEWFCYKTVCPICKDDIDLMSDIVEEYHDHDRLK